MAKITINNLDFSFTDADVCNPDNFVPDGDYNPHNIHPWLLHDHGFTVAIVFASNLQDAIDEAVDEDKMDRYAIGDVDLLDYHDDDCASKVRVPGTGNIAAAACTCDTPGVSYLGNAGEPFDIETLGFVELQNPPASWAAQFEAHQKTEAWLSEHQ